MALCEALDRLDGTRIRTNIRNGDEEQFRAFGLIDSAAVARKFGLDGRLLWCEITLSDWVFDAIEAQDVLTLHRNYFRLRKPLERRMYELARKHCARQRSWAISVELLHIKSGSKSPLKHFRYMLKDLTKNNHLPDYLVMFDEEKDQVIFQNRETIPALSTPAAIHIPQLDPDTRHDARMAAPGWDVDVLEQKWRVWCQKEEIEPKNPDRHFIKFCTTWYSKRGAAR
jgi:plasmid replication initiation protein